MLKRKSRKMKGLSAEETMKTYIEVLLFVGTITAVLFAVSTYIVSFDSVLADTSKRLEAIDVTYMMDGCLRRLTAEEHLTEDEHFIDAAILDKKTADRENIIRTCGIMNDGVGIEIEDIEDSVFLGMGERVWDFKYAYVNPSPHKHSIFVNIGEGDDIHVGELRSRVMILKVVT